MCTTKDSHMYQNPRLTKQLKWLYMWEQTVHYHLDQISLSWDLIYMMKYDSLSPRSVEVHTHTYCPWSIHITYVLLVNQSAGVWGVVNRASVSVQSPSESLHELIRGVQASQRAGTTARRIQSWSRNTFIIYRNSPTHEPILTYQSHIPAFIRILFYFSLLFSFAPEF